MLGAEVTSLCSAGEMMLLTRFSAWSVLEADAPKAPENIDRYFEGVSQGVSLTQLWRSAAGIKRSPRRPQDSFPALLPEASWLAGCGGLPEAIWGEAFCWAPAAAISSSIFASRASRWFSSAEAVCSPRARSLKAWAR